MRDLERELRELGAELVVPATPDFAARFGSGPHHERADPRSRRRLVLVLAVIAAVIVGVAASPARTGILRFFGIGAERIELVDRLPSVQPETPLFVGSEIDPADAPFPLLRSDFLGDPDHVYASGDVVTLLYGSPKRVRLLVTEIGSDELRPEFAKKLLAVSTALTLVRIPGVVDSGLWVEDEPHVVELPGAPPRLAGNTLVWTKDRRTLRIEGELGVDDAVRIAESFR